MMTLNSTQKSKQDQKLLQYFSRLNTVDKETLLNFAEFLCSRTNIVEDNSELNTEIEVIPRPENETVINAIKRLTASYPLVEKEKLLHSISALMSAHLMQGKDAELVIDELEALFLNEY